MIQIKLQRTARGQALGACLMIGAGDLPFVDSGTKWLTIEKKLTENGLFLLITGEIQKETDLNGLDGEADASVGVLDEYRRQGVEQEYTA